MNDYDDVDYDPDYWGDGEDEEWEEAWEFAQTVNNSSVPDPSALPAASNTVWKLNLDSDGHGILVVYENGEQWIISADHPDFLTYQAAAQRGENLHNIKNAMRPVEILQLSDRITMQGDDIFFDGEPIHGRLVDTVNRYHREGRNMRPILRFMERLYSNTTNQRSRDELFKWCEEMGLEITHDGLIIGYKAVREDFTSIHAGRAEVNGEVVEGHIPNQVGSVISMPRHEVDDNSGVGCSTGLHVGNMRYVRNFGGYNSAHLVVTVDPGDVVSVPREDCGKMRTCRYTVLEVHDPEKEYEAPKAEVKTFDLEEVAEAAAAAGGKRFFDRLLGRIRKNEELANA